MRRISLALALLGAVAAAGCGGAGGTNPPASQNKGLPESTFKLTVLGEKAVRVARDTADNTKPALGTGGAMTLDPTGGVTVVIPDGGVVSDGASINCGISGASLFGSCSATFAFDVNVTLSATNNAHFFDPVYPNSTAVGSLHGWAGACTTRDPQCIVEMNQARFVAIRFSSTSAGLGAHGPFNDPAIHVPQYLAYQQGAAGALVCTDCHGGPTLVGAGNAPACSACHASGGHNWPIGPHFDSTLDAFSSHEASGACVRCHTTGGYQYFTGVGVTGTPGYLGGDLVTGAPTSPVKYQNFTTQAFPAGSLLCAACHNSVQDPANNVGLGSVIFPSAYQATGLDASTAACVQCHQGRKSKLDINAKIGANTPDQQIAGLTFQNGHYGGSGATLFGNLAGGWAEYPVTTSALGYSVYYTGKNDHGGVSKCTFCHDAHSGELPADGTAANQIGGKCGACHFDSTTGATVTTFAQLDDGRQYGFNGDIDGNGVEEGLRTEIKGLGTVLFSAMKAYSITVVGTEICYDPATNPYYFNMAAGGGCDTTVQYANFTPRLLRAAYNYQWFIKEPGAWAHNPRYAIENMFDSITDLNNGLGANKVPFSGIRSFDGHFGAAPTGAAFNHWANFTGSNTMCAVCHSGKGGFGQYIATYGNTANTTVANDTLGAQVQVTGMQCATCHSFTMDPSPVPTNFKALRTDITAVRFNAKYGTTLIGLTPVAPSTAKFTNAKDMICASCHTGYETAATIATNIGAKVPGDFTVALTSPHYLGAATMMYGSDAGLLWQYPGKTYAGVDTHHGTYGQCTECHNPQLSKHTFEVDANYKDAASRCNLCHNHLSASTATKNSFARDQNVAAMKALLLSKISAYAVAAGKTAICYDGSRYSYWFQSAANGGQTCASTDTTGYGAKFDSTMVKAAFNMMFVDKEPGAWAHNYKYAMQVMFDSMLDLDPTFDYTNNLPIDQSCIGTSTPSSSSVCDNGPGMPIMSKSFGR